VANRKFYKTEHLFKQQTCARIIFLPKLIKCD